MRWDRPGYVNDDDYDDIGDDDDIDAEADNDNNDNDADDEHASDYTIIRQSHLLKYG